LRADLWSRVELRAAARQGFGVCRDRNQIAVLGRDEIVLLRHPSLDDTRFPTRGRRFYTVTPADHHAAQDKEIGSPAISACVQHFCARDEYLSTFAARSFHFHAHFLLTTTTQKVERPSAGRILNHEPLGSVVR